MSLWRDNWHSKLNISGTTENRLATAFVPQKTDLKDRMLRETKQKKTAKVIGEDTQYIPSVGSPKLQENQTINAHIYVELPPAQWLREMMEERHAEVDGVLWWASFIAILHVACIANSPSYIFNISSNHKDKGKAEHQCNYEHSFQKTHI